MGSSSSFPSYMRLFIALGITVRNNSQKRLLAACALARLCGVRERIMFSSLCCSLCTSWLHQQTNKDGTWKHVYNDSLFTTIYSVVVGVLGFCCALSSS
jgi:hypothetical protein